jgi:hypothetical protein
VTMNYRSSDAKEIRSSIPDWRGVFKSAAADMISGVNDGTASLLKKDANAEDVQPLGDGRMTIPGRRGESLRKGSLDDVDDPSDLEKRIVHTSLDRRSKLSSLVARSFRGAYQEKPVEDCTETARMEEMTRLSDGEAPKSIQEMHPVIGVKERSHRWSRLGRSLRMIKVQDVLDEASNLANAEETRVLNKASFGKSFRGLPMSLVVEGTRSNEAVAVDEVPSEPVPTSPASNSHASPDSSVNGKKRAETSAEEVVA